MESYDTGLPHELRSMPAFIISSDDSKNLHDTNKYLHMKYSSPSLYKLLVNGVGDVTLENFQKYFASIRAMFPHEDAFLENEGTLEAKGIIVCGSYEEAVNMCKLKLSFGGRQLRIVPASINSSDVMHNLNNPCHFCGSISHEYQNCPARTACYFCFDTDHRWDTCPLRLICNYCGSSDHAWQNCELKSACLYCGGTAHSWMDCPVKNACFHCGSSMHKWTECSLFYDSTSDDEGTESDVRTVSLGDAYLSSAGPLSQSDLKTPTAASPVLSIKSTSQRPSKQKRVEIISKDLSSTTENSTLSPDIKELGRPVVHITTVGDMSLLKARDNIRQATVCDIDPATGKRVLSLTFDGESLKPSIVKPPMELDQRPRVNIWTRWGMLKPDEKVSPEKEPQITEEKRVNISEKEGGRPIPTQKHSGGKKKRVIEASSNDIDNAKKNALDKEKSISPQTKKKDIETPVAVVANAAPAAAPARSRRRSLAQNQTEEEDTCFQCGQSGHRQADCPLLKASTNDNTQNSLYDRVDQANYRLPIRTYNAMYRLSDFNRELDLGDVASFCIFYGIIPPGPLSPEMMRVVKQFDLIILDPRYVQTNGANIRIPGETRRPILIGLVNCPIYKNSSDEFDVGIIEQDENSNVKQFSNAIQDPLAVDRAKTVGGLSETTDGDFLIKQIDHIVDIGLHGVFLKGLEKSPRDYAYMIMNTVKARLDELEIDGIQLFIMVEDGITIYDKYNEIIDGVLLEGITMKSDGTEKLRFGREYTSRRLYLQELQRCASLKPTLVVMLLEVIESVGSLQPHLVNRFRLFCTEYHFLGWLAVEPSFTDISFIRVVELGVGAVKALIEKTVYSFHRYVTSTITEKFDDELDPSLFNAILGSTNPDIVQQFKELEELSDFNERSGALLKIAQLFRVMENSELVPKSILRHSWIPCCSHLYSKWAGNIALGDTITPFIASLLKSFTNCVQEIPSPYFNPVAAAVADTQVSLPTEDARQGDALLRMWVDDIRDDYSTSAVGQKEFGYSHSSAELAQILSIQFDLRARPRPLLRDLSNRFEVEIFIGSPTENAKEQRPSNEILKALKILDEILSLPAYNRPIVKALMGKAEQRPTQSRVMKDLKRLRAELEAPASNPRFKLVHCWSSDQFSLSMTSMTGERRYLAVAHRDESSGSVQIYIARHHPNPCEAIIYCYMALQGWTHHQCLLIEALARQELDENGNRRWRFMSDRLYWQVKHSLYRELASFYQKYWKVRQMIRNLPIDRMQTFQLELIAVDIWKASRLQMLNNVNLNYAKLNFGMSFLTKTPHFSFDSVSPTLLGLQKKLYRLASNSVFRPKFYDRLLELIAILSTGMIATGVRTRADLFLHDSIIRTLRSCVVNELYMNVCDACPYLVREVDVATVYLEMNGQSDEDIKQMFDLSKHDVGKEIFRQCRTDALEENPDPELFELFEVAYSRDTDRLLSTKFQAKKIGDGMFFFFPFVINLLLVVNTGVGLLTSTDMDGDTQNAIGMSLILVMVTSGMWNGAYSRIGSYYNFQWSFHCVHMLMSRFFIGSCLFVVLFAGCGLLIYFAVSTIFIGLTFFTYFVEFFLMLITMGFLFTMHLKSIWVAPEGRTAFIAMIAALLFNELLYWTWHPNPVTIIFVISLFLIVMFQLWQSFRIAHHRTIQLDRIFPYTEERVLQWYLIEKQNVDPVLFLEQLAGKTTKHEVEMLKIRARRSFAKEIASLIAEGIKDKRDENDIILVRVKNYSDEDSLIHWQCLQQTIARPDPWSKQWDLVLLDSVESMQTKRKTDMIHRGGVVWDLVTGPCIHGIFFFAILFLDKLIRMFTLKSTNSFFPTNDYERVNTWIMIYILLGFATLEPLQVRLQAAEQKYRVTYRVGDPAATVSQMTNPRARILFRVYFNELTRTAIFCFIGLCVCTLMLQLYVGITELNLPIFIMGVIGLTGFLMGSFNALFLGSCFDLVMRSSLISFFAGLSFGILIVMVSGAGDLAISGLLISGWMYYFCTMYYILSRDTLTPPPDPRKVAPLLSNQYMTTGQRWIGTDVPCDGSTIMEVVAELEMSDIGVVVNRDSAIGEMIITMLKTAKSELERLHEEDRTHLIYLAFPDGAAKMAELIDLYLDNRIRLVAVPEKSLRLSRRRYLSAMGVLQRKGRAGLKVMNVYVGIEVGTLETGSFVVYQLSEALIHEAAEQFFGLSHREACVMEQIFSLGMSLPARTIRQISLATDAELYSLEMMTDDKILELALMGCDLNLKWERLSNSARRLVMYHLHTLPLRTVAHNAEELSKSTGLSRDRLAEAIDELGLSSTALDGITYFTRLARVALASRQCIRIKHASTGARRRRALALVGHQAAYVPPKEVEDEHEFGDVAEDVLAVFLARKGLGVSWNRRWGQACDNIARMMFLALTADSSFARELAYSRSAKTSFEGEIGLGTKIFLVLMAQPLWRLCRYLNSKFSILPLRYWRSNSALVFDMIEKGLNRTLYWKGDEIVRATLHDADLPVTGFTHVGSDLKIVVHHYYNLGIAAGVEPIGERGIRARCVYEDGRIMRRVFYLRTPKGALKQTYTVFFDYSGERTHLRGRHYIPTKKFVYNGEVETMFDSSSSLCFEADYNYKGREETGIYRVVGKSLDKKTGKHREFKMPVRFHYHPGQRIESLLMRVEFDSVPFDEDDPTGKLIINYHANSANVKEVEYVYSKKFSPILLQYVYSLQKGLDIRAFDINEDGSRIRTATPDFMWPGNDYIGNLTLPLVYFNIQDLPTQKSIFADDLILSDLGGAEGNLSIWSRNVAMRLRPNVEHAQRVFSQPYSTRRARTEIWDNWNRNVLECMYTRNQDEEILRRETALDHYWSARTSGNLEAGRRFLSQHELEITQAIFMSGAEKLRTHLMIRMSDLKLFGDGGEAHENDNPTETDDVNPLLRKDFIHVMGLDSGTWPADGGGVASCRRDVVDNLESIRWNMVSEVGTPSKQVMYQTHKNVASLTFVPLWGTEIGGPSQIILSHMPYGILSGRRWVTNGYIVRNYWLPIVKRWIKALTIVTPDEKDCQEMTLMFFNMYVYFNNFDWLKTWTDPSVKFYWRREALLLERARMESEPILRSELPLTDDVDMFRQLCMNFLMPITVDLPHAAVAHASHHGLQAMPGVVLKYLASAALIIWDHGVLWRERIKALGEIPVFPLYVRNGLVGMTRVAAWTAMYNCDMLNSCCTWCNPEWEARIGGWRFHNQQTINMTRKISSVVNGMETNRFFPSHEKEKERPTSIMLSHVYDLKDVKNAIISASFIVHKFRLDNFQLLIYGSLDKDQEYTKACRGLIAAERLEDHVKLEGLGAAADIIGRGWVFVNSSKSEGLPLALGEAGLAGLLVVCTDVGGSREIVTENGIVYGKVVPPRDPESLARAQLEVMCMLGDLEEWGCGADDIKPSRPLSLEDFRPLNPTSPLTLRDRMAEMKIHRHRLGMKFRAYVMANFNIDRYLREHEQMMWTGALRRIEYESRLRAIENGAVSNQTLFQIPTDLIQKNSMNEEGAVDEGRAKLNKRSAELVQMFLKMEAKAVEIKMDEDSAQEAAHAILYDERARNAAGVDIGRYEGASLAAQACPHCHKLPAPSGGASNVAPSIGTEGASGGGGGMSRRRSLAANLLSMTQTGNVNVTARPRSRSLAL